MATRLTKLPKICDTIERTKENIAKRENKGYLIAKATLKDIMVGWTKKEVIEDIMVKFELFRADATRYYNAALATLDERNRQNLDNIVKVNKQRLEGIIDQCHEDGDKKAELQAIDLLNKMVGAYQNKLEIETNNSIFEIKLGN